MTDQTITVHEPGEDGGLVPIQIAWRNPRANRIGTVDVEINDPRMPFIGWGPFTIDPDDVNEKGALLHAAVSADGVVIADYVPPVVAREDYPDLNRKQFRLGMRGLGVTGAMIDAALAAIPDEDAREIAQINWEDSVTYSRAHPLVAQLAAAFGKTDEQIDAAWTAALSYT